MLFLCLFYGATGMIFGLLVLMAHSALRNSKMTWRDMVYSESVSMPKLIISEFLSGKYGQNTQQWPRSHYVYSALSALQFMLIAWRSESAVSMMLLSLLTLCFIFLMLNEVYAQSILQKEIYILSGCLACAHAIFITSSVVQALCTLGLVCVAVGLIQLCSRLFIRSNCLPYSEVVMVLVSSILIPIYLLPNYLFLLSIVSFLWALGWRIVSGDKNIPLMPAFIAALWICLLFSKSPIVAIFNY